MGSRVYMRWQPIAGLAVVLTAPLSACAQHTTDPDPASVNLLPNGSFERNGQATLDTWQVPNPALASSSPQAAPGGGSWSLRLEADAAPSTGQARFRVEGLRNGDRVRLSAYVRAAGSRGGGLVGLEVISADGRVRQKPLASSVDMEWVRVSITERLSLEQGDTVWVVLSSPPTQLAARVGLFDLVTLERLG
jgi:hypothetical protein